MVAGSGDEMEGPEESGSFDNEPGGTFELRKRRVVECAKETIENAQRLIKRKIPCAGHLLAPRRLWLRRVATPNCDVVLVFSPEAADSILMWLLQRLRQSIGLTVHVRHHASTHSQAFYITATNEVLLRAAEQHHLPKQLLKAQGGGLKEFTVAEREQFEGDEKDFFTTQERQWLLLRLLEGVRARVGDFEIVPGLLEGQLVVPRLTAIGVLRQVFPLHEAAPLEQLQINWVRDVLAPQPLDDIAAYFGCKVAMYFAWLGHYTLALAVPACAGAFLWLCDGAGGDLGYVLFSVLNVVWVSVYVQAWKRRQAELAWRWGTLDQRQELLAEPRPGFAGPLQPSPVTGRLEPHHPAWRRHVFRYCVTVPSIVMCLVAVFAVMSASLRLQDWWDAQLANAPLLPSALHYVPKVMLAIVISLMDEAYFKIAIWLNDKENYRLETKYENHLIGKVALFQFVNSFLSLFYIAFYLQDQARLKEQLAALLISRQVIGNLKESALPYLLEQMRLAKLSFDLWGALSPTGSKPPPGEPQKEANVPQNEHPQQSEQQPSAKRTISQAELESSLFKYDGTFADHLEMVIQLGYVVLFSSAFPAAALCALLNNLVEIRSDAFKLAYVCQRPFGQRTPNIGTWLTCIDCMGYCAVIVNCALIGLSGQVHRMFPDMTATQTILLIVLLEHVMLCVRFIITCAIPDLPDWLSTEMAKVEYARREAQRLTSSTPPCPSPGTIPLQEEQTIGRFSVSASPQHAHVSLPGELSDHRTSSTPPSPQPPMKHHPITISADSIQQIPPFRPRNKSRDETGEHHLTIGPSGGAEWCKRLKDEGEMRRSADCLAGRDASSSDTELHRGSVAAASSSTGVGQWPPLPRNSTPGTGSTVSVAARLRANMSAASAAHQTVSSASSHHSISTAHHHNNNHNNHHHQQSVASSSSHQSTSSQETREASNNSSGSSTGAASTAQEEDAAAAAQRAAEELAAKKTRVKQSLMKRARSVAIFSLKLKERRAREAERQARAQEKSPTQTLPPPQLGGEMSCIPIEKLIQLEDVRRNMELQHQGGGAL